jgi:hypothetical protein
VIPPVPDRTGRRQTVLIVTIAVLALLLGIGGFATFILLGDKKPGGSAATGPSSTPSAETPTTPPEETPSAPASASDVRFVTAGQCLVNDGTNEKPVMRVVPCAPGTFEVLKRFDATADFKKNCPTVPGYEFHFFYNSPLDALDFVLCMKKR